MKQASEMARRLLRRNRWWVTLRDVGREGWGDAYARVGVQRAILRTGAVPTARAGDIEVRVLTWRRDWLNMLWALKSFYFHSQVRYPLFIHDGGLEPAQMEQLQQHFPQATLIPARQADGEVNAILTQRGWHRAAEYRRRNQSTRKLFDFFLLSSAHVQINIDSDIVFFQRPDELLGPVQAGEPSRYNRDEAFWYSMTLDELEQSFGIRPPDRLNSGLCRVRRETIDIDRVNGWLHNEVLFANEWVTEQTLHALLAAVHGVQLLDERYQVSTDAGFVPGCIAKHYPGFYRPLLYQEGMRRLQREGFLEKLGKL
jgi:hypothetical protein